MRLHPLLTALGLMLLCAFLYLWGLGEMPFYTKAEPREASVVWEIYTSGEWILPLRNGVLIPSKPPLFHWLGTLVSFLHGGVTELTVRLPSALLAILGVLLTYRVGVMLWGVEAGLIAALVLATSFEWVRAAITARVDMTLTVFMVMAFLFFFFLYRRRQVSHAQALGLFFLLGLATLAKGPVGAVLPGLTIAIFLALRRDFGFLRQLHLVSGGVVLIVVAGSWYALALWQGGHEFFAKQIMKENVLRFFASEAAGAGHEHPFYFFIPNLFLGMAPWSFFFPPLVVFLYQRRRTWDTDGFLYFVVWIATVFFFYSAASGKRSVYILPLYPAVALLMGAWWQELRRGTAALPRSLLWLIQGSGYFGALVVGLAILIVVAQAMGLHPFAMIRPFLHRKDQANLPLFTGIASAHPWAFLLWVGVVAPAVVVLLRALSRQRWGWVFVSLATFTVSTFLLVDNAFQPTIAAARTFRPFMARVTRQVGDAPLFFYPLSTYDSGAVFYAGRRIPHYTPALQTPDQSHFVLMWEENWAQVAPSVGSSVRVLDTSEGTGPKGNHRLLLVQVPVGAVLPWTDGIPTNDDAVTDDAR